MTLRAPLILALLTLSLEASAAPDVDPSTLYSISTQGSSTRLKAGEKGVFVLAIQSKAGAHLSEEAPLRLALSGKNVTPEKTQLEARDSVAPRLAGHEFTDSRFEVPLRAAAAGAASIEARITFFVCTETLCARQQKLVSLPIEVY